MPNFQWHWAFCVCVIYSLVTSPSRPQSHQAEINTDLLNHRHCALFICIFLLCSASVVCGKQNAPAKRSDVLVLNQGTSDLGEVEVFCNEQHLPVHPIKRYWTAIASGPDIVLYRDDRRQICRTDIKSVVAYLNRVHFVGNLQLPPLTSVKQVMSGLAVIKSDNLSSGAEKGDYVCYITVPNSNADFSRFLDNLFALPERPGIPMFFLQSGSKKDAKFLDQLMYFENKVKETKYTATLLRTRSWKRIADDSKLWKVPSNYQPVKQVGDITLQGDWNAVLDGYRDYGKDDI